MLEDNMTEQELWHWMWEGKYPEGHESAMERLKHREKRRATATLKRDIVAQGWNGHYPQKGKPEFYDIPIAAGTKVNVVMVSRMGDVGITTNLEAENGYSYRVQCLEGCFLGHSKIPPEDLLENIEPTRKTNS